MELWKESKNLWISKGEKEQQIMVMEETAFILVKA